MQTSSGLVPTKHATLDAAWEYPMTVVQVALPMPLHDELRKFAAEMTEANGCPHYVEDALLDVLTQAFWPNRTTGGPPTGRGSAWNRGQKMLKRPGRWSGGRRRRRCAAEGAAECTADGVADGAVDSEGSGPDSVGRVSPVSDVASEG